MSGGWHDVEVNQITCDIENSACAFDLKESGTTSNVVAPGAILVILITSVEDRDRFEGYRLGADSYVRKPVDSNEFVDAITRLGLYWLILNVEPPVAIA
jgi:hypothetical protein